MKKVLKKYNKTFIASLLMLVLIVGAAVTVAFSVARSNDVKNTFKAAEIDTEIEEEFGVDLTKKVKVTNSSEATSPAFIRVRISCSPEDIEAALVLNQTPGNGWMDGGDGFYYYLDAVMPGGSTAELLSKVDQDKIPENVKGVDFDIVIYQEAVVATATEGVTLEMMQQAFANADV